MEESCCSLLQRLKKNTQIFENFTIYILVSGDRGSTVVKVLCYKSVGRCFDPGWCQWIFH